VHAERLGKLSLAVAGRVRKMTQYACLRRRHAERLEPPGERRRGVRPDLGEQERGASSAAGSLVRGGMWLGHVFPDYYACEFTTSCNDY
jgi:hypothetical protein